MPILELTDFAKLKAQQGRLIALDLGEKVISVAICDPDWNIASALANINHKKFTTSAEEIFKIIDAEKISGTIIGLPLNMDGTENRKCQSSRQFGRNLLKLRDMNICFFDERFSTVMAEENLSHSDISWDKKQELVDKIAASYILQGFLDKNQKYLL